MNKTDFLNLMCFAKEWSSLDMYPDEFVSIAIVWIRARARERCRRDGVTEAYVQLYRASGAVDISQ